MNKNGKRKGIEMSVFDILKENNREDVEKEFKQLHPHTSTNNLSIKHMLEKIQKTKLWNLRMDKLNKQAANTRPW